MLGLTTSKASQNVKGSSPSLGTEKQETLPPHLQDFILPVENVVKVDKVRNREVLRDQGLQAQQLKSPRFVEEATWFLEYSFMTMVTLMK